MGALADDCAEGAQAAVSDSACSGATSETAKSGLFVDGRLTEAMQELHQRASHAGHHTSSEQRALSVAEETGNPVGSPEEYVRDGLRYGQLSGGQKHLIYILRPPCALPASPRAWAFLDSVRGSLLGLPSLQHSDCACIGVCLGGARQRNVDVTFTLEGNVDDRLRFQHPSMQTHCRQSSSFLGCRPWSVRKWSLKARASTRPEARRGV